MASRGVNKVNRLGGVVKEFSEQYGLTVIPVTVDGRASPDLPDNAQMASLMNVIAEGGGRAVLSGDQDQLKSLESGAPFALALERSAAGRSLTSRIENPARSRPWRKP